MMSITPQPNSTTAKVSAKGWIVIPAALRRKYRIQPGETVRIVDYGGLLGLVPALGDPVREARGVLASPDSGRSGRSLTAALLAERRREYERESS